VPGSPYATSTDNYIVTNGASLFTVDNAGSTLDTYSLNKSDGSLTLANTANAIQGNPYPLDIVGSLALDHTGTSLYVGEFDSSGDDGFGIFDVSGSAPKLLSFFSAGEAFGPPLVFSPDNQYAYSGNCYHASWTVFGYKRAADGTLTSFDPGIGAQAPPKSDPNTMYCPTSMAVSAKGFLEIGYSELNGSDTSYMVGLYKINFDGTLIALPSSVVTTASNTTSNGKLAINFDPTGTYLAVAGNGGVQTLLLNSNGILPPVGKPQDAGVDFQSVAWDQSNHVFATSQTQLYVYNSQEGQLAAATGSPQPGGAGLTVLPLQ
jgi:6-phosphogluconolactonase (cycloisomerase 2 family)